MSTQPTDEGFLRGGTRLVFNKFESFTLPNSLLWVYTLAVKLGVHHAFPNK